MRKMLRKLMQDESGASLIEYVLIAALISIAAAAIMGTLGTSLSAKLEEVDGAINQ